MQTNAKTRTNSKHQTAETTDQQSQCVVSSPSVGASPCAQLGNSAKLSRLGLGETKQGNEGVGDLWAAGAELSAEGASPRIEAVRDNTGGRSGSAESPPKESSGPQLGVDLVNTATLPRNVKDIRAAHEQSTTLSKNQKQNILYHPSEKKKENAQYRSTVSNVKDAHHAHEYRKKERETTGSGQTVLERLTEETSKEVSKRITVDFPIGAGLMVNVSGNVAGNASVGLKPDMSLKPGMGKGTASVSASAGGSLSLSGSVMLGVSAGVPKAVGLGVGGDISLAATGSLGGTLAATGEVGSGEAGADAYSKLTLSGDIGLKADITATGSVVLFLNMSCINELIEHKIPLASYPLATWQALLAEVTYSSKSGLGVPGLSDAGTIKWAVPDWASGLVEEVTDFASDLSDDNDAAAMVDELEAKGLLASLPASERAKLISRIMDPVVGEAHENRVLTLLRSESDPKRREEVLLRAYADEHGATGTVPMAMEWLRGSLDNHLFGNDNEDAVGALFPNR